MRRTAARSIADRRREHADSIARGLDPLLGLQDTADRMGTTVSHVRELIRTGRLTHVRVGRFMRVPTSAVAEFIAASLEVGR